MTTAVSPLAPRRFPTCRRSPASARNRRGRHPLQGRTDVLLALFDKGTRVAGVFTRSKCPSAPVDWCRANLKRGKARARWWSIPATPTPSPAGPAATAAKFTAAIAAKAAGCKPADVFLASTGVIGEPLDATRSTA